MKNLIAVAALLLTGCAVGPNYQRPQIAAPTRYTVVAEEF